MGDISIDTTAEGFDERWHNWRREMGVRGYEQETPWGCVNPAFHVTLKIGTDPKAFWWEFMTTLDFPKVIGVVDHSSGVFILDASTESTWRQGRTYFALGRHKDEFLRAVQEYQDSYDHDAYVVKAIVHRARLELSHDHH